MQTQETLIIKKFCRGNRKFLFSIPPLGVDFETPIVKFLFVIKIGFAEMGFKLLEENSDEHNKIYLSAETNTVIIVMINSNNRLTEVNRVSRYVDYNNQLAGLEYIMSQFIELYGAPHEWLELNNDVTACSWDATNGNSLSVGFNSKSNEIVCKYLRSQSEDDESCHYE